MRVSVEALAKLRPFAEQAGVDLPGLNEYQPKVDLENTVSDIARHLGAMCSRQPIFLQAGCFVGIDDEGKLLPMSAERFGSWVEKFVTTFRWTKDRGEHACTIPKDLASRILAADAFRSQIRELIYFFPVRLPVERPDGSVELLARGYDEQTRSWTEVTVEYDTEQDWDETKDWIHQVLGEWPWADRVGRPDWTLGRSRDASVVLAGMLGVFCRALFRPGDRRPLGVVSGNQPGTGKTTLCKLMMSPVYGLPPEMELPPTEEKFSRLLESVALGYSPFLFLDDVGRMIRSNALNKFVTASVHGGTRLYTQQTFEVPNVTQVFVTGNDLAVDVDARRRMMWSELFLSGEVQGREFRFEVTDTLLGEPWFRAKTLAALWSIVRTWATRRGVGDAPKLRELKSFERYCRTIGPMLHAFGWSDPFEDPPGISGGDTQTRDFKVLLTSVADSLEEAGDFTSMMMVERARALGVLEHLAGGSGDPDLKKDERIRWGRQLEKYRGRIFQRTDGKYFEFGKRHGQGGAIYRCRIADRPEDLT